MTRMTCVLIAAALAVPWAASDDLDDDRSLIQEAAQQQPAPARESAPPAAANAMDAELAAAQADAQRAQAKVALVLARKALAAGDYATAGRRAQEVLALLEPLTASGAVSEAALQAEGILARVARAGVDVDALPGGAPAARHPAAQTPQPMHPNGPQPSDRYVYQPGQVLVDVDAILGRDRQRAAYQDALRRAYKEDETRLLIEADEARIVPDGVVSYPSDWPQRVARRAEWADGQIARSSRWVDDQGEEWYVAVYDIHDLIYVPPDFGDDIPMGPWAALRDPLDRAALREHAFTWGFWGGHHADVLPLFHAFGGLNPWVARGPKYSAEKQQEVIDMIRAFTGGTVHDPLLLPPAPR
jgi:hypothetical protein